MNKATFEKQQDGTIKLTITILKADIKKAQEEILSEYAKNAKVDGFRKGKVPQSLILDKVDNEEIKEEVLKELLPHAYSQAVQTNNLKPIMNPKIHVEKMDGDKDWEVTAITCEMPDVDLGAYKDSVKKITAKSKIIVPGKEQKKPENAEVMKALLENVKINIPGILIEHEADKLLSQLLNDIKKLGLSLDQYLASTNRTPESVRQEYGKRAEEDMKIEFAMHKIAETEKIVIGQKEIDEAIQKAKDENERKSLESNRYLLAAILRQQKTLDFLLNL
jgi:FKBP-type peptidyl-prolyl cis-trans isomerase (trigger factor)